MYTMAHTHVQYLKNLKNRDKKSDMGQPLIKVPNKRKYSEDGEISNNKLIKFTAPATQIQRESSMKVNLPNMPVPRINNNHHNMQSIALAGTSKNNGVKSLVQLCTMTLVSNKHR